MAALRTLERETGIPLVDRLFRIIPRCAIVDCERKCSSGSHFCVVHRITDYTKRA
jgi:hypothetical protein